MQNKNYREGLISAIVCNIWWGIMPIYWHWLKPIESSVIIYYRILLVAMVSLIIAYKKYGIKDLVEPLKEKGLLLRCIIAGIFITANWSIYIWAVNAGHVIQTCIGYYIEPLIICVFGIGIFKEKVDRYKVSALALASLGVAVVVFYFKEIPLIAITVAITFSTYAAIKKKMSLPPLKALFYETIFQAPIALIIILYLELNGKGAIGACEPYKYGLLMLCGLFTAFPLTLFANATNKLNLFIVGIVAYISPTISLLLSIFLFKEPFESVQLISFAIIWVGLGIFSYGEYRNYKNNTGEAERFAYPKPLKRVTGGPGGEAILIMGSEKTALYDLGMACFADKLIDNISKCLMESKRNLDYVLLSHTHYDHIGGLPYVMEKWPNAVVYGSQKAKDVFESRNALNTIKNLGESAQKKYGTENVEITVNGMGVDKVLSDGDRISLGKETIIAYETKGHTDCSLSYFLLPQKIMLASESTGVYASDGVIYTQPLKSLSQTITSAKKLSAIEIDELIIPHYGRYPGNKKTYFQEYINAALEEKNFLFDLFNKGYTVEEALLSYEKIMWVGKRREEQPYEAYKLNAEIVISKLFKEWNEGHNNI